MPQGTVIAPSVGTPNGKWLSMTRYVNAIIKVDLDKWESVIELYKFDAEDSKFFKGDNAAQVGLRASGLFCCSDEMPGGRE